MAVSSLVQRLLAQAEKKRPGGVVSRVHILVGILANVSPASLQRQFGQAAVGSPLAEAELVFHLVTDPQSPDALAVRVVEVDPAA